MKFDTFYNKNAMDETRLNVENTRINSNVTVNAPKMPTRYGEITIPIESVVYQGALDATRRSANIIPPNQRTIIHPYQQQSAVHQNYQNHQYVQQPHSQLPYYQYGYQQQCCPTYALPVYYDGEMQVREEWQRPVNGHIAQQEWRFVNNQKAQKQIRYKTVVKDDEMIPTQASHWDKYYDSKVVPPPVIPPKRQVKTCCSPLLLGLLGLLALAGIITGIVLALKAHNNNVQKPNTVDPNPIVYPQPINPYIPAQPIINNSVNPVPAIPYVPPTSNRPSSVQPISSRPIVNVTSVNAITAPSSTQYVTTQPISKDYTNISRPVTAPTINPNVNFDNDFQVRPTGNIPTPVNPTAPDNNDYQVPPGYIIDQNGMLVRVQQPLHVPTSTVESSVSSGNTLNTTTTTGANANTTNANTSSGTPTGTTQPQISWQTPSHTTRVSPPQ